MDGADVILDPNIATTATNPSESPSDAIKAIKSSARMAATRHTLFTASSKYPLLLSRLNLPPPLGAPSMGDGAQAQASAGPGAWLPRGSPIVIEGAAYDLPSATRYGVEEIAQSSNSEWRVRVGMVQGRNAGAIIEVRSKKKDYTALILAPHADVLLVRNIFRQSTFPFYACKTHSSSFLSFRPCSLATSPTPQRKVCPRSQSTTRLQNSGRK